ncbi:MAG: hypothetical protein ACYC1Z_07065 [Georgenia sp.]
MSNDTTTMPASDPLPSRCEHCDDSVPHEHLDVKVVIEESRTRARDRAVRQLALAAAFLIVAAVVAAVAAGIGATLGAAALAAAGWVVANAVALGVVGVLRARTSDGRALVSAALTAAGLMPLVALLVAALVGGWPAGLVAAATWLLCGAVAEGLRARTWRALLLAPGDAGERARARAVGERANVRTAGAGHWLVPGVAVGLATWLLTPLPVAVLVLVPLSIALTALAASRTARGQHG